MQSKSVESLASDCTAARQARRKEQAGPQARRAFATPHGAARGRRVSVNFMDYLCQAQVLLTQAAINYVANTRLHTFALERGDDLVARLQALQHLGVFPIGQAGLDGALFQHTLTAG